jgi:ATP-dependent protease HslVU (ClpYQ) ATPase subunit
VLDEISFAAPEMAKDNRDKVLVDADYVKKMVADIAKDQDLSRYIL